LDKSKYARWKMPADQTRKKIMNMIKGGLFVTSALATVFSAYGTTLAQEENGDPIIVKWEPAPSISSPDGRFEMNLRGRLFIDGGWINDANDNENTQATEFRAARLGIEGKAWSDVKYKFEADFAGNEVVVKDAYLQFKGPMAFTFGQFKTPNSLEEQTSSRYITFMERASFTDAFGLARMIGFGVGTKGDDYTFKAGVFRGSNSTSNEDEGLVFAGRATYGPKLDDIQLHFGASFRYRDQGADQRDLRYRQRPHQHLAANRYVATARIADSDTFYGAEAAVVMGPISLQGEWAFQNASLSNPAVGQSNPTFSGGYIEASYMLTGESRAYSAAKGSFQRIRVNNPVYAGGSGAFQVAARFDRIDLSDQGIFGGEQNTVIIGANWWLNRHTRFMINYSHATIKNAADVSFSDVNGENNVDAFGIRAQIDW
jgi:phosphate-selective porin OprO and OprP